MPEVSKLWVTIGADTTQADRALNTFQRRTRDVADSVGESGRKAADFTRPIVNAVGEMSARLRDVVRSTVQASQSTQDFSLQTDRATSSTTNLSGILKNAASSALGFATAIVGLKSISSIAGIARDSIISFSASLEQTLVSFETLLSSADDARAFLFDLQKFAALTPFEFKDVERGARRLLAMGFAAKDVKPLLMAVGNAAAALGLGSEGIDRITRALGQMRARTKVAAQEMIQLTEAGVPAWEILAQAIGKPIAAVQEMVARGEVAAEVMIDAFMDFVRTNWPDLMIRQAHTFAGAISTIKDSVSILASTAFEPLFRRISQAAQAFAEFLMTEDALRWSAQVAAGIEAVIRAFERLGSQVAQVAGLIAGTLRALGVLVIDALQALNPFARHSPSLVEQVEDGTSRIVAFYSNAAAAIEQELQNIRQAVSHTPFPADIVERTKVAISLVPDFVGAGDLEKRIDIIAERARELGASFSTAAIDADLAKQKIELLSRASDSLQSMTSRLGDALSRARERLQELLRVPIAGTRELEERLAAIEDKIAQAQLRLVQLRLSRGSRREIALLVRQIEQLQLEAEEVRLEKRVQIDPLRRQIERLAQPVEELPFDELSQRIIEQRDAITALTPALEYTRSTYEALREVIRELDRALEAASSKQKSAVSDITSAASKLAGLDLTEAREQLRAWREQFARSVAQAEETLAPVVKRVSAVIQFIADIVARIREAVDTSREGILAGAAALRGFLKELFAAVEPILRVLEDRVARVLSDLRVAIDRVAHDVAEKLPSAAQESNSAFSAAGRTILEFARGASRAFLELPEHISSALRALSELTVFPRTLLGAILSVAGIIVRTLATGLARAGTAGFESLTQMFSRMTSAVSSIATELERLLGPVVSALISLLGDIATIIARWIDENAPLLRKAAETIAGAVSAVFETVFGRLPEFLLGPLTTSLEIAARFLNLLNKTVDIALNGPGGLAPLFRAAWDIVQLVTRTAVMNILDTLGLILKLITGDWSGAWDNAVSIVRRSFLTLLGIVRIAVNALIQYINALIDRWNSLQFRTPALQIPVPEFRIPGTDRVIGGGVLELPPIDWKPFEIPKIEEVPEIPGLAKGGIVQRPTLAVLAEEEPEAVIPLSMLAHTPAPATHPDEVIINLNVDASGVMDSTWPVRVASRARELIEDALTELLVATERASAPSRRVPGTIPE